MDRRRAGPDTIRFYPVAAWYGGGEARAPMLEPEARAKREAWRKDVQQIKALGFNTVRAWIDWASGQPSESRYDFETLDVLLELAEEEQLKLVLQVYMDSAPPWIGEKHPDSLFVSANGESIRPIDWKAFIVDKLGEDLRDRYEAVKRVAPKTIVTKPRRRRWTLRIAAPLGRAGGRLDDGGAGGFLRHVVLSEALRLR